MEDKENIDWFDDYRSDRLSEENRQQFEWRRDHDAAFRQEYEQYLQVVIGVEDFERQRLKNQIKRDSKHLNPTKVVALSPRKGAFTRWSKLAAAMLFLVMAYSVFQYYSFDHKLLRNHHLDPVADSYLSPLSIASSFEESKAKFHEGYRALEEEKYQEAIQAFTKVSTEYFDIYYLAQYFKALAYIGLEEQESAKDILDRLLKENKKEHFMKPKVSQLRKDLDRNWLFYF